MKKGEKRRENRERAKPFPLLVEFIWFMEAFAVTMTKTMTTKHRIVTLDQFLNFVLS